MARLRLRAYWALLAAQVRSQAQYRTSFAVDVLSSLLFGVLDLTAVLVMFRVTPALAGFGFDAVLLMTALASCGFALADLLVGNIERLGQYVRTGVFDAVLVRPLGALVQLAAMDIATRRVGRVIFGLLMIVVAVINAGLVLTPTRLALLVITPLAGALIFSAVFVATATVAFWWIESGEAANGLTYGGLQFTQYPITIYGAVLRRVFAYGIGFAFVAYYPALAVLGRPDPLGGPAVLGYAAPLVGLAAAGAAGALWRLGLREYRSTGS